VLTLGKRLFLPVSLPAQLTQRLLDLSSTRIDIGQPPVDVGNGGLGVLERIGRIAPGGFLTFDFFLQRGNAGAQVGLPLARLFLLPGKRGIRSPGHAGPHRQRQARNRTLHAYCFALPWLATAAIAASISAASPR
jgi:hypothetical protein